MTTAPAYLIASRGRRRERAAYLQWARLSQGFHVLVTPRTRYASLQVDTWGRRLNERGQQEAVRIGHQAARAAIAAGYRKGIVSGSYGVTTVRLEDAEALAVEYVRLYSSPETSFDESEAMAKP